MKTYSPITEYQTHPDDNRVHVPEGWNPVMYCDDTDEEDEPVLVSSLPEPGQVIIGVFNDHTQDWFHRDSKKKASEAKGEVYNPEFRMLIQYMGLDYQKYPILYSLTEPTGTLHSDPTCRVFKPRQMPMVAWLPTPDFSSLFK